MADCKSCEYETMCTMPEFVRNNLKSCKVYEPKEKKTNADRIRAMSDAELAEFLAINIKNASEKYLCSDYGCGCYLSCKRNHICDENVEKLFLMWLQSEAE